MTATNTLSLSQEMAELHFLVAVSQYDQLRSGGQRSTPRINKRKYGRIYILPEGGFKRQLVTREPDSGTCRETHMKGGGSEIYR